MFGFHRKRISGACNRSSDSVDHILFPGFGVQAVTPEKGGGIRATEVVIELSSFHTNPNEVLSEQAGSTCLQAHLRHLSRGEVTSRIITHW
jgi:hypothetical protein